MGIIYKLIIIYPRYASFRENKAWHFIWIVCLASSRRSTWNVKSFFFYNKIEFRLLQILFALKGLMGIAVYADSEGPRLRISGPPLFISRHYTSVFLQAKWECPDGLLGDSLDYSWARACRNVHLGTCNRQMTWTASTSVQVCLGLNAKHMPANDKTYYQTCAIIEDSDHPTHPRSMIRVFADRKCLLQPPGYPKRDKQTPVPYWVDVQADLSLAGYIDLIIGFVI